MDPARLYATLAPLPHGPRLWRLTMRVFFAWRQGVALVLEGLSLLPAPIGPWARHRRWRVAQAWQRDWSRLRHLHAALAQD